VVRPSLPRQHLLAAAGRVEHRGVLRHRRRGRGEPPGGAVPARQLDPAAQDQFDGETGSRSLTSVHCRRSDVISGRWYAPSSIGASADLGRSPRTIRRRQPPRARRSAGPVVRFGSLLPVYSVVLGHDGRHFVRRR
jgi:hypothetical protein